MADKEKRFDFDYFVSKVIYDEEFALKLSKDPRSALEEIGIEPTGEILTALENIDEESIKALANAFGRAPGIAPI